MHKAYRALCICSNMLFANDRQSDFLKQASFCVFKLRGYFKAQHEIHLKIWKLG